MELVFSSTLVEEKVEEYIRLCCHDSANPATSWSVSRASPASNNSVAGSLNSSIKWSEVILTSEIRDAHLGNAPTRLPRKKG